ncbi:MAG TPA: histidine kinase [Steroidobacteraceae bacterium]|nr:histidine kinase [Steroidobacteraceae bacterium]
MPTATSPAKPGIDRALFALWVPFWLLMILVSLEDNLDDRGVRWWMPVLWEGSSCLFATALLWLQQKSTAHWDVSRPGRWFGRQLAWMPVIAVVFVATVFPFRHAVYALAGEAYQHRSWPHLLFYEGVKLLLFAGLWLGIIFGLKSFASWRTERERLLALQKHLAESQLAQLKAQLQPHFLFNALNTISSLMQVDVERADRLLTQLADLLRATLQAGTRDTTSLREELELLQLYARIMQERFAGRVTLGWHIEPDALEAAVPTMLLQPLLENAYRHGVERSTTPVAVDLSARRQGDRVEVAVRNDGLLGGASGGGIGLRNCRERLAVLYGSAATLTLATEGASVVARLSLPWQRYTP